MFNVCPKCANWTPEKHVDQRNSETVAVCPDCGHAQPFLQLPLYIVCGPSGGGKSTVMYHLPQALADFVVLEQDIWYPAQEHHEIINQWLRLVKNIHLSGRSVVLLGSGLIPQNVEERPERRYIGEIHYLALVCELEEQKRRLNARPAWRGSAETWQPQYDYTKWFYEESNLPLLDTTHLTVAQTTRGIADWVLQMDGQKAIPPK